MDGQREDETRVPDHVETLVVQLGLAGARVVPLDTGWGERSGLYLVTEGNRRLVLKVTQLRRSAIPSADELTRRASTRLEIETYRALHLGGWRRFRHPRLLSTDGRSYLLLEHVQAARWPADFTNSVVLALFEFQHTLPSLMSWRLGRLLQAVRRRSPWRILLQAGWGSLRPEGWKTAVRTWKVYTRARIAIARSSTPRLAQHGDMTYGNVVADSEGHVWFIDFQHVLLRQRLAFRDVAQLAVDPSSAYGFDSTALRAYAEIWSTEMRRPASDVHAQLRAALLLHVLYVLYGYEAATPRFRAPFRRFLQEILLEDDAYDGWLESLMSDSTPAGD